MKKNSLGYEVTRPDQVLSIMRGISGSGKSTKAKEIVGKGIIHSTDALIEQDHVYSEFFKLLEEKPHLLGDMHKKNLAEAVASMKYGIPHVVIDNMNLLPKDAKPYVVEALRMGFADKNIKFVDIGTGGASNELLAERNTHGLGLELIDKLVRRYKSGGNFTIKAILEAKDEVKPRKVLYSAVVLDDKSRSKLLVALNHRIPKGWEIICHHMTIIFGKGLPEDMAEDLGKKVNLFASEIGVSDKAIAVKVDGYKTTNEIAHITLAVNRAEGGKPFDSNAITQWESLNSGINLSGTVSEIKV